MADNVVTFAMDRGDAGTVAAALTCFVGILTGDLVEAGAALAIFGADGAVEALAISAGNYCQAVEESFKDEVTA